MSETKVATAADAKRPGRVRKSDHPETVAALRALNEATRAAREEAQAGQRKMLAIAGGALVGALVSAAIAGVVGMRAMADLREAGQIQAAAGKIAVEQVRALTDTLAKAALDQEAIRGDIAAFGAELELSIQQSMAQPEAEPPDLSAITKHMDASIEKLRQEIMAAIAESVIETQMHQGALPLPTDAPKLAEAAPEPAPKPAPKPKPETAPKPKPETEAKASPQKSVPFGTDQPAVTGGAFAYP